MLKYNYGTVYYDCGVLYFPMSDFQTINLPILADDLLYLFCERYDKTPTIEEYRKILDFLNKNYGKERVDIYFSTKGKAHIKIWSKRIGKGFVDYKVLNLN